MTSATENLFGELDICFINPPSDFETAKPGGKDLLVVIVNEVKNKVT